MISIHLRSTIAALSSLEQGFRSLNDTDGSQLILHIQCSVASLHMNAVVRESLRHIQLHLSSQLIIKNEECVDRFKGPQR